MKTQQQPDNKQTQHPDEPFYRRVMVLMMVSAVALVGVAVMRC